MEQDVGAPLRGQALVNHAPAGLGPSGIDPSRMFTPGPWVTRRAAEPDNTGGYDWAIVAPGNAIIAECFEHVDWREPGLTYDIRPAEAHARLFAAAPELLDAMIVLVSQRDARFHTTQAWGAARTAIAKALGQ